MKAVGIISEFNPFHSGHAYLIEEAKKVTGAEFAVVIMNGNFVQRGEPAVFDKYTRTEQALKGGADLIFELPLRFGISSAGDFALGGILALSSLGFVSDICFGSECGNIHLLSEIALLLSREEDKFRHALDEALRHGLSYPAARACALSEISSMDESILSQPNNILGIEYCLSILKTGSSLNPLTIMRDGQAHQDSSPDTEKEHPSGAALREQIYGSSTPHLTLEDFSEMIGYALFRCEDLTRYKDISPDLADRMKKYIGDYHSVSDFISQCQTKAYTTGRIRRGILQCLLSMEQTQPVMPYLRILGMKKEASCLLRQSGSASSCILINKLSTDINTLTPFAKHLLEQDLFASHLYRQTFCRKYNIELPNEFQRSPIIV
ncbi:MAG: nucleotidyltransferase family protein [Lachnospiraceae bacterium]|nr:nucleotidyltransferase family protein [Lachnospiraceae bacterium]